MFDRLDVLRRGSLTLREIDNFMKADKDDFTREEIEALIKRFNKEKMSNVISLPEFLAELTP
jgi:Ca2+-binding EF-hand superfamily protein